MARVAEVERAARDLPWIVPHFGAVVSDLSAFHRIDEVDDIGMARFIGLLEHLHAYGGAYAQSVRQRPPRSLENPRPRDEPVAGGDIGEAELRDRWAAVMAQEFPDHIGQGVETVSADEMARLMSGG